MTRSFGSSGPAGCSSSPRPFNFRIHAYPDDYWRMTPSCLRRMLSPYAARVAGWQGHRAFPHTVMAVGVKAPAAGQCFRPGLEDSSLRTRTGCGRPKAALPAGKLRRRASQIYRSKGERSQIADYYAADFTIDIDGRPAQAG